MTQTSVLKNATKVPRLLLMLVTLCLGFSALPASAIPYKLGDVFVAVANGKVQHRDAAGNLLETLDTLQGHFTTGMAFDSSGNLYVTNFDAGNVRKFDNQGTLLGTFGGGYSGAPESIVFDMNGNAYVGAVAGDNRIRKFDPLGNPLAQFTATTEEVGTDWIELAADQCTIFYTSEGFHVKRFDVCTNTQLSDFNSLSLSSNAFALRILPDGGVLVADRSQIVRLDAAGNSIQSYNAAGENCWFALNLDPDGKSFWSADFCSSNVYRFDIATGQQLLKFNTGTSGFTVFGLVIFGEIAVGKPSVLHATAGNQAVFLYWNPSLQPIDSYRVSRLDQANVKMTFDVCKECTTLVDQDGVANGQSYRYTLTAIRNGVEGPPSNEVFARPNKFESFQLPSHRRDNPILFLHGFHSSAGAWDNTKTFLSGTVGWDFGGTLSYQCTQDPLNPTTFPQLTGFDSKPFDSNADFYTATFGQTLANYSIGSPSSLFCSSAVGRPGVLHQADEVMGFVRQLTAGGKKVSIVAHSLGGMAARSYVADNQSEAVKRLSQLTTYGTPHWGVSQDNIRDTFILCSLASFFLCADVDIDSFIASRGAQDLRVDCTSNGLDYSQEPSDTSGRFLDQLRLKKLPSQIQYFAIRGLNDLVHQHRTPCLSKDWDLLITVDTADLGTVPPSAPAGQPPLTTSAVPILTTDHSHLTETSDFSSILCALDRDCFIAAVRSPVDIHITAPDGRSMARQLSEIPGASYMEPAGENAQPKATVFIPFPLGGDYAITVTPKAGASLTDTYTLEIVRAGVTTIVAQDQKVQDIPAQPYVVTVLPPIPITIKPGDTSNPINPGSRGTIPVAILSTPSFNAPSAVDLSSLTFGRIGTEQSLAFCNAGGEDVNGDGRLDLVCHFNTQDTNFTFGDVQGVLKGKTQGGVPFVGTDSVLVVQ